MIVKRNRPPKNSTVRRIIKRQRPSVGEPINHTIVKRNRGVILMFGVGRRRRLVEDDSIGRFGVRRRLFVCLRRNGIVRGCGDMFIR